MLLKSLRFRSLIYVLVQIIFAKHCFCSEDLTIPATFRVFTRSNTDNPLVISCKDLDYLDYSIATNCTASEEKRNEKAQAAEKLYRLDVLMKHQYIVSGWLSLSVTLVGIIGNILTIGILFKSHMRNSTNTFITGLAFTDLISLLIIIFLVPLKYIFISHNALSFYELHTFLYPYLYPLAATFQFSSIYLMVVVCTNRVITLYFPSLSQRLNVTKNCCSIIIAVILFAIVSCLPLWFYYKVEFRFWDKCFPTFFFSQRHIQKNEK